MPSGDDHARLQSLGTVVGAPESGLRYMRRRRVGTADRNGDPLDGLVNMFDVAIAFAVALLVAVSWRPVLAGCSPDENLTIVTNPGTPEMQVIVKEGDTDHEARHGIRGGDERYGDAARLVLPARGRHHHLGARGPDRARRIHARAGRHACALAPTPTPAPYPTPTLTPYPTSPPTPTPGVTLTPDTGATPCGTT